ncbi:MULTISPECIES: damage-inducible type I toxin DinQ [unclassified Serratia (in: enterobacteria)]|uniref:damage-inducible type I toxin DinQ n=1 Tax=unclassified Serratia (in: enterobacteria) TaxID=2647522 RepID=UPI0012FF31E6|nr:MULTISPECIES: damage-inducible type I toxin DinQ [unclassified Serratia (in: enterobacteria)]
MRYERFKALAERRVVPISVLWPERGDPHLTMKIAVVTGSVGANFGVLSPLVEKRMETFIDKVLIVLKALVALLELIRRFIDR